SEHTSECRSSDFFFRQDLERIRKPFYWFGFLQKDFFNPQCMLGTAVFFIQEFKKLEDDRPDCNPKEERYKNSTSFRHYADIPIKMAKTLDQQCKWDDHQ